jgi:hypothetical protein
LLDLQSSASKAEPQARASDLGNVQTPTAVRRPSRSNSLTVDRLAIRDGLVEFAVVDVKALGRVGVWRFGAHDRTVERQSPGRN